MRNDPQNQTGQKKQGQGSPLDEEQQRSGTRQAGQQAGQRGEKSGRQSPGQQAGQQGSQSGPEGTTDQSQRGAGRMDDDDEDFGRQH